MLEQAKYFVRQKRELLELFGFETRNKYQILDASGAPALFVAEQNKSIVGALARQFFGHWQRLNLHVYNERREQVFDIRHPFSWIFQRVHIHGPQGELIGKCIHRFGILRRKIDILDANDGLLMQIRTPIKFFIRWEYPIYNGERVVAQIDKKFTGVLSEFLTDKDNFQVSFVDPNLPTAHRALIVGATILVDLLFFETKASD